MHVRFSSTKKRYLKEFSARAVLFEEENRIFMKKTCPDHGEFKDLVWEDYPKYKRVKSFSRVGPRLENPRTRALQAY